MNGFDGDPRNQCEVWGSGGGKRFAAVAQLYTEDAQVLPPDWPIVTGKKAIENFWKEATGSLGLIGASLKTPRSRCVMRHGL